MKKIDDVPPFSIQGTNVIKHVFSLYKVNAVGCCLHVCVVLIGVCFHWNVNKL